MLYITILGNGTILIAEDEPSLKLGQNQVQYSSQSIRCHIPLMLEELALDQLEDHVVQIPGLVPHLMELGVQGIDLAIQ
jgi:hypothetical protein